MDEKDYGLTDVEKQMNQSTMYINNMKIANSYNFEIFDIIKELKDKKNFAMTITSKRCTGKSILMKDLCYNMRGWYENVYVFSMTASLQPDLFNFVPKDNVFNGFDEARIQQIWDQQVTNVMRLKKLKTDEKKIPKILLIFDDLISDPRVKRSEILKRLYVAGRHVHFAQIFISQTFVGVPPTLRTNVDVAIAFYLDSYDNRDSFARQYLSTKNNRLGVVIFDKITKEPYQAIVVLNFKISQNPEEYIKTYVAREKIPKFKLCLESIPKLSIINKYPGINYDPVSWLPPMRKGAGIKL